MSYQIQVRLDDGVKQPFENICGELGLSMSGAMNVFAKAVVRYNGLPFNMSLPDEPAPQWNKKWLLESIAQLERGEGTKYNDVSEILPERA